MRKTTLSAILAATGLALAGAAQAADSFESPSRAGEASTMTNGEPNAETTNSPYSDGSGIVLVAPSTTVLGAGPATVTTYETTTLVAPATYSTIVGPVVTYYGWGPIHGSASETSNVPERAGEASTMTNGVPNASPMN